MEVFIEHLYGENGHTGYAAIIMHGGGVFHNAGGCKFYKSLVKINEIGIQCGVTFIALFLNLPQEKYFICNLCIFRVFFNPYCSF